MVTCFLYLNTLPEGQGCTEFPALDLRITPKRGCGVLFCNLLPNGEADPRTAHRACPVPNGLVKFGINVWLCDTSLMTADHIQSSVKKEPLMSKQEFSLITKKSALVEAQQLASSFKVEVFILFTNYKDEIFLSLFYSLFSILYYIFFTRKTTRHYQS